MLLAINDRLKTSDIFWFSLFHEIKHVLQKRIKLTIVTDDNVSLAESLIQRLELEADGFARDILIPREKYLEYIQEGIFTEQSIKQFAEKVDIDPGIVLGRLQKDKYVPYSYFNNLKIRYEIQLNFSSTAC
ncbi:MULTISPECIES: ImmA/IrrE family metallo-endopeptidase [Aminobacterium]|uniref:ImmA/IrrE family metallo-endopeptidase n=1 Tax=Aminobacterium TaxID=81466 RepID=UPI00257B66F7|nr:MULTISPECIES: ImmA/IrrE family metallo-endopeptidase [unclassified Aminobacterium]